MASKKDEKDKQSDEAPYQDVSAQLEEAREEAQKPVEYDDEGNPKASDSTAAAEVEAEMSRRGAGSGEGGGPWPPELLAERYVGTPTAPVTVPEYTSHEDAEK